MAYISVAHIMKDYIVLADIVVDMCVSELYLAADWRPVHLGRLVYRHVHRRRITCVKDMCKDMCTDMCIYMYIDM